jgi:hypothetical protein
MYYLIVYIPSTHLEVVKNSILEAGAGKIGGYDYCCWQTKGLGQFRAGENNEPFVGEIGEIHKEEEWKVEFVVEDKYLNNVIKAMKASHPYEVVAYSVIKTVDI